MLVILTDMTNYCEALREVSASHGEIPSRKGYPGYMYSDLATLYERAGCIRGLPGTLTQLPILTMPGDDIGHPDPGPDRLHHRGPDRARPRARPQRHLSRRCEVLPSLSRLMDAGTGEGFTHADHPGPRAPAVRRLCARRPRAGAGQRDGRGGPARERPQIPRSSATPSRRASWRRTGRARWRKAWRSAGSSCAGCRPAS